MVRRCSGTIDIPYIDKIYNYTWHLYRLGSSVSAVFWSPCCPLAMQLLFVKPNCIPLSQQAWRQPLLSPLLLFSHPSIKIKSCKISEQAYYWLLLRCAVYLHISLNCPDSGRPYFIRPLKIKLTTPLMPAVKLSCTLKASKCFQCSWKLQVSCLLFSCPSKSHSVFTNIFSNKLGKMCILWII